jgi:DNA repair protein RadC
MTTLYVKDSGGFREACDEEILHRAQGVLGKRFRAGSPVLTSPARTREFLRIRLGALDYEVFGCLHLDKRHRLITAEDLFRGTIEGALYLAMCLSTAFKCL